MKPPPSNDVPQSESHGVDTLIAVVYDELRRLARAKLRAERAEHTLQPTALVHEAYVRLKNTGKRFESETEFRRVAAPVIRHVLIDHARRRTPHTKVTVDSWEDVDAADGQHGEVNFLALHEGLERLAKRDAELARLLEMRYFGGLTEQETADEAGIPLGTLKDRLKFARMWLRKEMTKVAKR